MKFKSIYLTQQCLWAILAFLSITAASAQTVKGLITDVKNEPLVGASIVVEGTTKGAITNEKGDYSLDVTGVDKAAALVFSFVGFDNQRIAINGQSVINVILGEGKSLNVALGTLKSIAGPTCHDMYMIRLSETYFLRAEANLPDTHPRKKEVNELAKNFFMAVLKYQNMEERHPDSFGTEGGLWHQEMTDKTSFVETSGSGLMLYGLGIAIEKGVIDKSFTANFKKGLSSYLSYIAEDGSVSHATIGCLSPRRGTKMDYANHVWKYNDPHAFGPAVLAFTQAAKMGINKVKPLKGMGIYAISDTIQRKPQVFVRYMPEANQNICWENDRIAYRLYGSPVKDRVSSGIDVWTKSVDYPIIDKWYRQNEKGKEYHVDWGEGCDFFHVGFSRGDGGTAIWHNGKPYISQPYAYHRILKNTEAVIAFEIFYNPWTIDGFKVSERKVISMKMGTNFFKVVSTFETDYKEPLTVGIGIAYVKNPEILTDAKTGSMTIWESYMPQNGELGTTILANPSQVKEFVHYKNEQFVLINAKAGQPNTYYVGAGWTKAPQFKTKQDWLDYVNKEIAKMAF